MVSGVLVKGDQSVKIKQQRKIGLEKRDIGFRTLCEGGLEK